MTTAEQSFRTARAKHLCAADDRLRRRRGPAWEAEQAEKGRRTISAQAHRSRCQRFSDQTTRPSRSAREGRRSEATTTEAGCGSVEPDRPAPGPIAANCSCRTALPTTTTTRDARLPLPHIFRKRADGNRCEPRARPLFQLRRRRNRVGPRHARSPRRLSRDWCDSSSDASIRPPRNSRKGCPGRERAASGLWRRATPRGPRNFQPEVTRSTRLKRVASRLVPRLV